MTKLEELIEKYCPNGVPLQKVKDTYKRLKGTPITAGKMKQIACDNGEIKIFAGGKTIINAHEKDIPKANITRVPAVLVQSRGIIDVVYYDKAFTFKNEMWAYTSDDPTSTKYLFYVLKNNIQKFREAASGMGSLPQISLKVTEDFIIPVPPLEVQREIVRILDNFTSLKAELQARKKQYEYYRDSILSKYESVSMKSIESLCKVSAGGDAPKDAMSKSKTVEYKFPIISNGVGDNALYGYTNQAKIMEPAVTVAARGTIGYAEYRDYPYFPIIRLLSLIPNDTEELDTKFLYYCLQGKKYNVPTTGIPQLTAPMLKQVEIPLPNISVQRKIVGVLDNFEQICNDLNIGLPAEIKARQKQYEYYRDALLSFDNSYFVNVERERERDEWHSGLIKLWQYVFGYVYLKLDDIIHSLNTGLNPRQFFKLNTDDSTNYYITIREIHGGKIVPTDKTDRINDEALKLCNNRSNLAIGDILFSGTGTIGETAVIADEPNNWNIKEGVYSIKPNTKYVLPKFLRYLLMSNPIKETYMKKVAGGTVKSIPMGELRKIVLPVPPLEEQKLIVSILDRFDKLCNDISEGLPAEIEARQKQYEYYRDKLLSF